MIDGDAMGESELKSRITDHESPSRAVILLSGGLDSYTAGAIARAEGFTLFALTVRYGQRHARELDAARDVAAALGVARHIELDVDLSAFGGSSLTGAAPVPKDRPIDASEIPSTYVPARNTVFLSLALGWAEVLRARDLFIGVNALDYSGYPDCRPEFIAAFERLASLATATGVQGASFRIHAPLQHLTKARDHPERPRPRPRLRLDPQLLRSGSRRLALRPLRQLRAAFRRICTGRYCRSVTEPITTARIPVTIRPPFMKKLWEQPLRRQLFVFILLLLVPVLAAAVWSGVATYRERIADLNEQTRVTATTIAATLSREVTGMDRLTRNMDGRRLVEGPDPGEALRIVRRMQNERPGLLDLAIRTQSGAGGRARRSHPRRAVRRLVE